MEERLRPFLLPESTLSIYREVSEKPDTWRFGDLASIGIGYVSGANKFFHLRPSQADEWEIPARFLHPTVRNSRALPGGPLTKTIVEGWRRADEPVLLLRIAKDTRTLPAPVARYLDTDDGHRARGGYKCRMRDPWYSVPDVQIPDFFLTYMSGREASLVRNDAGCTCTNSVHSVRLKDGGTRQDLLNRWYSPFVRLGCEIEGHPLGGGLLIPRPQTKRSNGVTRNAKNGLMRRVRRSVSRPSKSHQARKRTSTRLC